jgi:hypothetical protein
VERKSFATLSRLPSLTTASRSAFVRCRFTLYRHSTRWRCSRLNSWTTRTLLLCGSCCWPHRRSWLGTRRRSWPIRRLCGLTVSHSSIVFDRAVSVRHHDARVSSWAICGCVSIYSAALIYLWSVLPSSYAPRRVCMNAANPYTISTNLVVSLSLQTISHSLLI